MKTGYNPFLVAIAIIIIIGSGIWIFSLRKENSYLRNSLEDLKGTFEEYPETLWVPEPYTPKPPYHQKKNPNRVVHYQPSGKGEFYTSDTVVDLQISRKQFQISLSGDSSITQQLYTLDLKNYKYSFSNGQLTQEKVRYLEVSPYVSTKYLLFNNILEVSGGVLFETSHLNYTIGVGCYYINRSLKPDIELGITYKF